MATIIDALVVTLGLDNSEFERNSQESSRSLKDFGSEAQRESKNVDQATKSMLQGFRSIRNELVGMLAVSVGGYGAGNLISNTIGDQAMLGRLGEDLRMSERELDAWGRMMGSVGGTADEARSSMLGIQDAIQGFAFGQDSSVVNYLRSMQIDVTDAEGQIRSTQDILRDVSGEFQNMSVTEQRNASSALGLTDSMMYLLRDGPKMLNQRFQEAYQASNVTGESAAAAREAQAAFSELSNELRGIWQTLFISLTPALERLSVVADDAGEWMQENREEIAGFFDEIIDIAEEAIRTNAALGENLGSIREFLEDIRAVAEFFGKADNWLTNLVGDTGFDGPLFTWSGEEAKESWGLGGFSEWLQGVARQPEGYTEAVNQTTEIDQSSYENHIENNESREIDQSSAESNIQNSESNVIDQSRAENIQIDNSVINQELPREEEAPRSSFGQLMEDLIASFTPAMGRGDREVSSAELGNEEEILAWFMANGWSREQSVGIVANLQAESALDPTAVGDGGQAYGIAQWHPPRQRDFEEWAGYSIRESSLEDQLAFINHEMRFGKEKAAGRSLMQAETAEEAARVVSLEYERPAQGGLRAMQRSEMARELYGDTRNVMPMGATSRQGMNTTNSNTTNNTSEVSIGTITVQTQATDANSISRDMAESLRRNSLIDGSTTGMN